VSGRRRQAGAGLGEFDGRGELAVRFGVADPVEGQFRGPDDVARPAAAA